MKILIFVIAFLLSGCNVLIKDEPKTGVNYIPIEFNVESIDYIKDYQSNETTWKMKPSGDIDVSLEIICPLTDRSDIKVIDLKKNKSEILVSLESKSIRGNILKRPIIKINLKGINPYKKLEYNLKINSNFDFIKTNLNSNIAKYIVMKDKTNINFDPNNIYVSKIGNKKQWTLEYPIVLTGNENPISKMSFIIDDATKNIVDEIKTQNSTIIGQGVPLIYFDDFFLYENSNSLYAYSIPKNKSIKILNYNNSIDIIKRDEFNNKIYILSKDDPSNILIINPDLSFETKNFNDYIITDFAIYNDILFFINKEKNLFSIYKYDTKISRIRSYQNEIKSIDSNGNDVAIELAQRNKNSIYRIYKDGKDAFIGNGSNPIIDNNSIYFINSNSSNSYIMNYNLNSGLSKSHISNKIIDLEFNNKDIIIKENVEGITKLSTFKNNILNEIISFPRENIYYSSKHNSIILLYKNNLYLVRLSN